MGITKVSVLANMFIRYWLEIISRAIQFEA